ncbi:hypothetical protein OG963_00045 [Streptomyces sp. NBC_01707]|uniref:hypothetical protein n=1 Tax=unclassified Streptomyces TaxID=2593676 RepID=UPI002E0D1B96|nr:hypothetical protein OG763_43230 [Streptomyces sp. NBC_01230]WSQ33068.1 hypothetical protein OG763_46165 [Streptomyces sp. NBC_01230]
MTKAGASGAKARARKVQQTTGAKYIRLRGRAPVQQRGRTVQFLMEDGHAVGSLPLQIAAVWARGGLRVLMLHEYEHAPMNLALYSRRVKERRAAEQRKREWPGHRSTVLWQAGPVGAGGLLASQHTPWTTPPPDPRRLTYDDTPLREAVALGQDHFDVVVIMGRSSWPRTEHVEHFVLVADTGGIPLTERVAHGHGPKRKVTEQPLDPRQSSALLRDRHLRFLHDRLPPFLGMVSACTARLPAPVPDPVFLMAVEADMARAGLPLLGCVTLADRGLEAARAGRDDAPSPATVAALASCGDHGIEQAAAAIRAHWG